MGKCPAHDFPVQSNLGTGTSSSTTRYKDEIPVFLILDMHVRDKKLGDSSLYIAYLINAQNTT